MKGTIKKKGRSPFGSGLSTLLRDTNMVPTVPVETTYYNNGVVGFHVLGTERNLFYDVSLGKWTDSWAPSLLNSLESLL